MSEEMIVLPKPPINRVDPKTGEHRTEQMPRTLIMQRGIRRKADGKVDPSVKNTEAIAAGQTFEGDPGALKRQMERGVIDRASAYYGSNRKRIGTVVPGSGYVRAEPEDDVIDAQERNR